MQRPLSLLFLLVFSTPLLAGAAATLDEWCYKELRDDLRLSQLLEHDVQSMADRPMGQVRDVIITDDGSLAAAVVEFQQGIDNSGVAFAIFEWSDAVVEPVQDAITVSIGSNAESSGSFDVSGIRASEIIGRRIVLADDPEFGKVVDMFLDLDDARASAVLVEAGGEQFVLPLQSANFEQDADVVRYPFDRQLVMQRGRQAANALLAATR